MHTAKNECQYLCIYTCNYDDKIKVTNFLLPISISAANIAKSVKCC